MKTFVSLLCALALLLGCAAGWAQEDAVPGNRLGLDVLAALSDGTKNAFVSPVSLAYALSLAAYGAEGATREEILLALDVPDAAGIAAWTEPLGASGLKTANVLFAKDPLSVREEYAQGVGEFFGAEVFPLDSAATVNGWVREKTDGLIDKLLDEGKEPDAQLLLINAIAMDAKWLSPFDPHFTREDVFHTPEGDVTAQFMRQGLTAEYAEAEGAQALKLPYLDSGLYMTLILPEEGSVGEMLTLLSEQGPDLFEFGPRSAESIIDGIVGQYRANNPDLNEEGLRAELQSFFRGPEPWEVSLSLPKLDISTGSNLKGALMDLGVGTPFSMGADFSGLSDASLMISDVIQKVRVQVDEEGTRAAAVTEIVLGDMMAIYEQVPVSMVLDRPFILLISDEETGAICFAGVVADPS